MAKPDKPLEISLDPEDMTLDDAMLFEERGFSITGLVNFLTHHSNWTREEIGALTIREFHEVAQKMRNQIAETAVPKAKSPSSNDTQEETMTPISPAG